MRNTILGALTLTLAGLASPGLAADLPFCAFGTSTCAEACDFATLAQCRAFLVGDKGYCGTNPRYTPARQANASTPLPRR